MRSVRSSEFAAGWSVKPETLFRTSLGVEISRWHGVFETPQEFPCATVPYTVVAVHENRIADHTLISEGREVRRADILPGSIQLVPAGTRASGRCAPGPFSFHHIHIPDGALRTVARDLECPGWELVDPRYERQDPLMVALAGRLNAALSSIERLDALHADELGHRFVSHLLRFYTEPGLVPGARPVLMGWRLKRVLDYIEERLPRPIDLQELADVAGYSISHFRAGFLGATSQSPSRFVMQRRIVSAQSLLAGTNRSIATIAAECGFVDQAHFTHRFKQFTRMTPARYRADRR